MIRILLLPFELRRIPGVAKTSPSPAGNQGLLQNTPKNTLPPGKLAIGATWRLLLPHLNQYGSPIRQPIELALKKRLARELTSEEKCFLALSFEALDEEELPPQQKRRRTARAG